MKMSTLIVFLMLAINIIPSSAFNGSTLNNTEIYRHCTLGNLYIDKVIRVTINMSADVNPSLIRTDGGYMIAFGSNRAGNYDIWVTNSTDGVHWSSPVQVTTNTSSDMEPSLIQTRSGYTVAFKSSRAGNYSIWLTNSSDGVQWSSPIQITRGSVRGDHSPSLIQTSSGFMIAFSHESTDRYLDDVCIISSGDGVSWSNLTRTNVGGFDLGTYGISLIQSNVGYMIAFTTTRFGDYDIGITNSSDGLVWSNATLVDITLDWPVRPPWSDTSWQIFPSLIQTHEGGYMLAFYSTRFETMGVTNSSDGATWSNAIQVVTGDYFDGHPSLIQTDSGYLIAFHSDRSGNSDVWVVTLAEDVAKPLVSVTISPSNPTTSNNVTFTVNATDAESGIANVTLYVDENAVKTWTTGGIQTYAGGPYSAGNHTYSATAYDNVGNKAVTQTKSYVVKMPPSLTLIMLVGIGLGIAACIGAIYYLKFSKLKKGME